MHMIEIISTELKVVDQLLLNQGYFIVRMEDKGWQNDRLQLKITYFKRFEVNGEVKTELIRDKDYYINAEQYDYLYNSVPAEALIDKLPFEIDKIKKQYGLLTFVTTDFLEGTQLTIGGLLPDQWKINE